MIFHDDLAARSLLLFRSVSNFATIHPEYSDSKNRKVSIRRVKWVGNNLPPITRVHNNNPRQ